MPVPVHIIKVVIADDHQIFVDGISALLNEIPNIIVTATANNGKQVLDILKKTKVDIVILDINMPDMDGLETAKVIHEKYPGIKVLVLTMYVEKEIVIKLIKTGVMGYVLKNTGKQELEEAIASVMNGKKYYSSDVAFTMLDAKLSAEHIDDYKKTLPDTGSLTKREIEILKLIALEQTTPEISKALFISAYTVETHRKNLIKKLGVKNLAGLVRYAFQAGLVK